MEEEASLFAPFFTSLIELHSSCPSDSNAVPVPLATYDIVGIFILTYLAHRKPHKWAGTLASRIIEDKTHIESIQSTAICKIPLLFGLITEKYLHKICKLCNQGSASSGGNSIVVQSIRVIDIFNSIKLIGIKKNSNDIVNTSIVMWAAGESFQQSAEIATMSILIAIFNFMTCDVLNCCRRLVVGVWLCV